MTDAARFTKIYRQHSVPIYRFVLHMSGSPTVAEEVTQDAFLELIRRPEGYSESRGPIGAYLYGIARHLVYRHLGRQRHFEELEHLDPVDNTMLDDLTRTQDLEALQKEILLLPEPYREVIVLCDLQEMSYESAAGILDCALGTVRSRLHRGRALLIGRMQARYAVCK